MYRVTGASVSSSGSRELWARLASAAVMLAIVIAVLISGGVFFALLVTLVAIAGLREWHRLIDGLVTREMPISVATVCVAVLCTFLRCPSHWIVAVLVAGALTSAISAKLRGGHVLWHAAGPIYVGIAPVCLVALRGETLRGGWVVAAILIAVWLSDTGALIVGRTFGGPKLVPRLSPNKTWFGFLGGVALAALGEAAYVGWVGGEPFLAALLGGFLSLVGHLGDLFESWAKRRFNAKNSGTLIPGHGGMLDRIDSLLFEIGRAHV